MEETLAIHSLPNEIISLILQQNDLGDILNFGATCVRFNDFVKSNHVLWKAVTKQTLPEHLYQNLKEYSDGDWLNELKNFHTIKKQVYTELIAMSPRFYKRSNDLTITDVKPFFEIALSNNFGYNYTIYFLQDIVREGNLKIKTLKKVEKPFTMTEMYYGKNILRHLMHTYLSLKWVRAHMSNDLPPEVVCNFFIQWIDTLNMHHDEDVDKTIQDLVNKVEDILRNKPVPKSSANKVRHKQEMDRIVLAAVTKVVYHQGHLAITTAANMDTIDIAKVINNRCANVLVATAIYHAVAKSCGVECELIAFPNHMFLEWRDQGDADAAVFTVDPASGEMHRRRRCPFSTNGPASAYRYCPDSLLQYLCSSFHLSMGNIRNWNTHNNLQLLDFLGTNLSTHNSYRNFLPYLLDHTRISALNSPLNLKHMSTVHMGVLRSLANVDVPSECCVNKRLSDRKRTSAVKYAVGMICFHTKYEYMCVVRDWDVGCVLKWQSQMVAENLCDGITQPFYNVIAADQSERYVPQENLKRWRDPSRMFLVEEAIATEFAYFDGYVYVPNDEKQAEYPHDQPVIDMYRERHELFS